MSCAFPVAWKEDVLSTLVSEVQPQRESPPPPPIPLLPFLNLPSGPPPFSKKTPDRRLPFSIRVHLPTSRAPDEWKSNQPSARSLIQGGGGGGGALNKILYGETPPRAREAYYGGGGRSTKFYTGRLRPEVHTLTLLYTIFFNTFPIPFVALDC